MIYSAGAYVLRVPITLRFTSYEAFEYSHEMQYHSLVIL